MDHQYNIAPSLDYYCNNGRIVADEAGWKVEERQGAEMTPKFLSELKYFVHLILPPMFRVVKSNRFYKSSNCHWMLSA